VVSVTDSYGRILEFIFIFILNLFKDTSSSSDYILSIGRTTSEQLIGNY
jgi:hypothetical protein